MDREGVLCETVQNSIDSNLRLLEYCRSLKSKRIMYTLCPRFVLSCSSELMQKLGDLSKSEDLPVHTHLSENVDEIQAVKELYNENSSYASVYRDFGLLGFNRTVMAHCVYSDRSTSELNLLLNDLTWIAHCPTSNTNLQSGIAPVSKLYNIYQIGLGSDISGGHTMNMFEIMRHAIQVSKLLALDRSDVSHLNATQAFYLATMGGGSFFSNVGSFLPGYKFNALVVNKGEPCDEIVRDLERLIYTADYRNIEERYIEGVAIHMPS